jgi:serine/threonine protein phosphatase 1
MIIISDIHGCFKTFKALIQKCPNDEILIAGDMIDRGPSSKYVVEYIRENNFKVILGNHESMAINSSTDPMSWLFNGGVTTLASFNIANFPMKNSEENIEFIEMIEWFKTLPLYYCFDDLLDENKRKLVVTHGACVEQYPFDNMDSDAEQELIWNRNIDPKDIKNVFNVFGHTPRDKVIVKNHYALIDTGCSYPTHGTLSAILFPEKEVITQKCID